MVREKSKIKKSGFRVNQWYVYTTDAWTDGVIYELKKSVGKHDTDHLPEVACVGKEKEIALWRVDYEEIEKLLSGKDIKNLKFEIYLEQFKGTVAKWEPVVRGKKRLKVVLPLYPLEGATETGRIEVLRIARVHSSLSRGISLVPLYLTFFDMMCGPEDIEQLQLGFRTTETMLMKGTFSEVWVYGDRISPGMQKIILLARILHIPVILKGRKNSLKESYAAVIGHVVKK